MMQHNLYSMHQRTLLVASEAAGDLEWSLGLAMSSKISRAAAFCTRCSGANVASGTPARTELQ